MGHEDRYHIRRTRYAVTVTALSVVLGLEFAKLIDVVFAGLLSKMSIVALGI